MAHEYLVKKIDIQSKSALHSDILRTNLVFYILVEKVRVQYIEKCSELTIKHESLIKENGQLAEMHDGLHVKYKEMSTCEEVLKVREEAMKSRDHWKEKYENLERYMTNEIIKCSTVQCKLEATKCQCRGLEQKVSE